MLNQGIYLAPSQYEAMFVSAAVKDEHVNEFLVAHEQAVKNL
jgi:glutamate-1-semialdehyde 2,1-aminomutase